MGYLDNFEKTLADFFFTNHPRQAKKIPQIMKEFKGREKDVMLHLCKTYKVDPNTIDGLNSYTPPVVEAVAEKAPEAEEAPVAKEEEISKEVVEVENEANEEEESSKGSEKEEKKKKKKKN